jgi:hypothetical protein
MVTTSEMKTIIFILILLFICFTAARTARADVFPYPKSSESLGGPVLSLELLGSREFRYNQHKSILFWGGFATVYAPYGFDINAGPEAAVEFRRYFAEKENKMWSFSVYSGIAFNFDGENYTAITPGIKLTRKRITRTPLRLEPYISLSYPFYLDGTRPYLPNLTFGFRFVFEKLTKIQ